MSFDLTILCIDYRDRTLIAALVVCTAASCCAGALSTPFVASRTASARTAAERYAVAGGGFILGSPKGSDLISDFGGHRVTPARKNKICGRSQS